MAKKTNEQLLIKAAMLERENTDSVTTGICTEEGCWFVTSSIEADSDDGFCEECEKNTIKSVFILAGVI